MNLGVDGNKRIYEATHMTTNETFIGTEGQTISTVKWEDLPEDACYYRGRNAYTCAFYKTRKMALSIAKRVSKDCGYGDFFITQDPYQIQDGKKRTWAIFHK